MHSNLVLGMECPSLAAFITEKANSMNESDKGQGFYHQSFSIGEQEAEFWFLPDDAPTAVRRIKDLIRSAQKTIHVAMFTWTRMDFAHEIIRAAKRGVHVQVVIDQNCGKGSSAKVVQFLKENNIDVRLSKGLGFLHHKFMKIDSHVLVDGSANWTKAAFQNNDDCFIVLEGLTPKQVEKLDDEWKVLYADSQPAT